MLHRSDSPPMETLGSGVLMHDDTMLPDDDRDLTMARRIGTRLAQHTPLSQATGDEPAADAAFYDALLSLKAENSDLAAPPGSSERVWAALQQQIAPDQAPSRPALRLIRSRTAQTWLAAASVALLIAAGWFLWGRTPAPVLVAAAEASIVMYTAPDGSVVRLRPYSELYALDAEAARYRLVGEGFFEVTRDETRTFTVEAGEARIAVLGTRFNVSTWGAETAVFLEEGRVRFEHTSSQQSVDLVPGQRSVVTPGGQLVAPEAADSSEYMDWLHQEMNFASRSLDQVLDELAHHYNVSFEAPPALRNERVTGRVLLQQIEQSLGDLGVILEGRFVEIDDETYRFVPD